MVKQVVAGSIEDVNSSNIFGLTTSSLESSIKMGADEGLQVLQQEGVNISGIDVTSFDLEQPEVIGFSPTSDNESEDSLISAVFNEAMDNSTINTNTFTVKAEGVSVEGSLEIDASRK